MESDSGFGEASAECRILGRRQDWVAVYKEADVLTHPSRIFPEGVSMSERLEAVLGQKVFPLHRLDRKTSGVLVFALAPEAAAEAGEWFRDGKVRKRYWAVVRGFAPEEATVDRALKHEDNNRMQPAVTHFRTLCRVELPDAVGPYPTARYSLVEAQPETGRRHQLRRHLRGMSHPIVGDTIYGDGRHNAYVRARFGWHRMFLHAGWLELPGAPGAAPWTLSAPVEGAFAAACAEFGWPMPVPPPRV